MTGFLRRLAQSAAMTVLAAGAVLAAEDSDLVELPISAARPTAQATPSNTVGDTAILPMGGDYTSRTGGLTLEALFASVEEHVPLVTAAEAVRDGRRAELLTSQGAFDTRLSLDYYGRLSGGTDGQIGTSLVTKRFDATGGLEVYGGYRISTGEFPIYEDILFTNTRGELKAGARISLLRNRVTDRFRTATANARLEGEAADQDYLFALVQIKSDAAAVYANWLYWVRNLQVYESLLEIATTRQGALQRSVEAGQLPAIRLDENRQLILSRQADLLGAQQRVAVMLQQIGLYYRDPNGQPTRPTFGPDSGFADPYPYRSRPLDDWLARVLDARPDIASLRLAIAQAKNSLALADNDRQANLDLSYEISNDFGSGSPTREGVENIVSLNFNLPLELRRARGQTLKAEAELKAIRANLRIIKDRTGLALSANRQVLTTTRSQIEVASDNVRLTERLQKAEETRYLAGASNFFELNTQETALANSQLRLILAQRDHDLALVDFVRLTGELAALRSR